MFQQAVADMVKPGGGTGEGNDRGAVQGDSADALSARGDAHLLALVRCVSLSLRHIEVMMSERGVFVDHSTVPCWAIKVLPVLAAVFGQCKRPVGNSWRMDETCVKVTGQQQ